jgi:hypothetical protein
LVDVGSESLASSEALTTPDSPISMISFERDFDYRFGHIFACLGVLGHGW